MFQFRLFAEEKTKNFMDQLQFIKNIYYKMNYKAK